MTNLSSQNRRKINEKNPKPWIFPGLKLKTLAIVKMSPFMKKFLIRVQKTM